MELHQVETFVAVVRAHSFTGAAKVLHISQPTVSRRIQTLEEELGCLLFDRDGTRAELTEAGRRFAPAAYRTLEDWRSALRAASHCAETSWLAIGATAINTYYVLPQVLNALFRRHSQCTVRLHSDKSEVLYEMVRCGALHLALVQSYRPHQSLRLQRLADYELVAVVNRHHPGLRRGGAPDWDASVVIFLQVNAAEDVPAESLVRRLGVRPRRFVACDTSEGAKRLLLDCEEGIGLLPRLAVAREIEQGSLAVVPLPRLRERLHHIWLVYPRIHLADPMFEDLRRILTRGRRDLAATAALAAGGGGGATAVRT